MFKVLLLNLVLSQLRHAQSGEVIHVHTPELETSEAENCVKFNFDGLNYTSMFKLNTG